MRIVRMPIGTRSVLFGAHCFFIHPWFVALGWWLLYGFPADPRLWVAFFIHDLGYWGKPNMDGPEGESHPLWGASVMARLFGSSWGDFCRYHSRYLARQDDRPFSRLCVADKYATVLIPKRLNLFLMRLSGEEAEYVALREPGGKYAFEYGNTTGERDDWYDRMTAYMTGWIAQHKDGAEDTWTPRREA